MNEIPQLCILCEKSCSVETDGRTDNRYYQCDTCGEYLITRKARINHIENNQMSLEDKMRIAICSRERTIQGLPVLFICAEDLGEGMREGAFTVTYILNHLFPSNVSDRMARALRNLYKLTSHPGERLELARATDYPVLLAESDDTADFVIEEMAELGYISYDKMDQTFGTWSLLVRAAGIAHIEELDKKDARESSSQAFIAMWFSDDVSDAFDRGILPAVVNCGYRPMRIDSKETNNKICDEIIAEINRSQFLIADFTGNRGGVYFKAGYAKGLGIPVIWTCRADCVDDLHFDTRQYSHIVWNTPEELYEKLIRRIAATIDGAIYPKR